MTRASLSPSSPSTLPETVLPCGPLEVVVRGEGGALGDLIQQTLLLYDVRWPHETLKKVLLEYGVGRSTARVAAGSYLEAARMRVDATPSGLWATTDGGAAMSGTYVPAGEKWQMIVPPALIESDRLLEVEDLLTLVLTTGWRRAGWVPLHAAGLVAPGASVGGSSGVLVCAASGGGKTTFTVAMVRRGWHSLGDDKLLMRSASPAVGDRELVASVKQMLNVDPAAAAWFPELRGIADLPAYSALTPKRRVSLGRLWGHAPTGDMSPTHLIVVSRRPGRGGIRIAPMNVAETISALLHQTVVPADAGVAKPIAGAVARVAQRLRGYRFEMFEDAHTDESALSDAERLLA